MSSKLYRDMRQYDEDNIKEVQDWFDKQMDGLATTSDKYEARERADFMKRHFRVHDETAMVVKDCCYEYGYDEGLGDGFVKGGMFASLVFVGYKVGKKIYNCYKRRKGS